MSKEECIKKLIQMKKKYYDIPHHYCFGVRDIIFKYDAYKKWAAEELINYLKYSKNNDYIETIEEFRWLMDCYACSAKTDDQNLIFSTAYDVASDFLDNIIITYSENFKTKRRNNNE